MQINMQIVLSQAEIKDAINAFVRQEVPIQEAQSINVDFADDDAGNLTAIVVVDKGADASDAKVKGSKIKLARKPPAIAEVADAPEEQPIVALPPPEDVIDSSDVPFDVDVKPEPVKEGIHITPKIFTTVTSSAPELADPSENPVPAAKSLFANLARPTNH
jgi:hypothetical protein